VKITSELWPSDPESEQTLESGTSSRKYVNSPISEAACEFRLPPESKWDMTLPGALFDRLKDTFPNKESQRSLMLEMKMGPSATEGWQQQLRPVERMRFLSSDRKTTIVVDDRVIVVSRLRPYESWSQFKPMIQLAFDVLAEVVEFSKLVRVGLRYINRIEIPASTFELEEYFQFRPELGSTLSKRSFTGFIVGAEIPFAEGRDLCRIQLTNAVPGKGGESAFVLDIDYFMVKSDDFPKQKVLGWIEEAHEELERMFEGCLTERLREIFGLVK